MKRILSSLVLIVTTFLFILSFFSIESEAASNYYIKINCEANVVTVYENGNPIKAMICSTGTATPQSGIYSINYKYRWLALYGNVYGQYCTRIVGNILFHSVPYLRNGDHNSLEFWEYDKLGTNASAGCIRLKVEDAKWIYDNCRSGTKVEFYRSSDPGPLGKPSLNKVTNVPEEFRGWDPTDPEGGNPWKHFYDRAFNSYYYAEFNPDLKRVFGYNEDLLKAHWYELGINEGRQATPAFNISYYLQKHPNLGNNVEAYRYYISKGFSEGGETSVQYNSKVYKAFNTDLQNFNEIDLLNHFNIFGYKEKRISSNFSSYTFNYIDYADYNTDLKSAFGYNEQLLLEHWLTYGINEGRRTSNNFKVDFYKNYYQDLSNMDNKNAILHFEKFGHKEGRIGYLNNENLIFDSKYYADTYSDLKKAFGYNENLLRKHFYTKGIYEGRQASPVFCAKFYIDSYPDLKNAFGNNLSQGIIHFLNNGINEERKSAQNFNLNVYKNNNQDLINAFSNNNLMYLIHYISFGRFENRICF